MFCLLMLRLIINSSGDQVFMVGRMSLSNTRGVSRNWQYKDVYRKLRNNQYHASILEANYYLSIYKSFLGFVIVH